MCGIFGAIHLDGYFSDADYRRFRDLTDLVSHRGPDAAGARPFDVKGGGPGSPARFDVFLGHRRLSILDLRSEADQPLAYGDHLSIIFNGEIFNFRELREELQRKGHRFTTDGDTEVILAVYREYGTAGFSRLNGMWAFALVDLGRRRVVLSRDRFSIKPLFLCRTRRGIVFASEIKQLLPVMETLQPQPEILHAYLSQGLLDHRPETFFEGIQRLAPKHNLILSLDRGEEQLERYWDYEIVDRKLSDEDAADEFRALFTDSVRLRLRSDVPIGSTLSGGLDSSAIAVTAARLEGDIETFSIISNDASVSEAPFIDELVRTTGIHNRQLLVEPVNVVEGLEKLIHAYDEPPGGFSAIAHFQMMEAIRKHTDLKVVLSGQGGDEVLLGYQKFFFFWIREALTRGQIGRAAWELWRSLLQRTVVWQFRVSEARRYIPWNRLQAKPYLNSAFEPEPLAERQDLHLRQMLEIDRYSVPNLTNYEDRNSMAFGIEIRLPFLDYRLVNFCLSLPVEQKMRGGWSKYILREAMCDLPDPIRWRRDKRGFTLPERKWLREDLVEGIERLFSGSVLGAMGILDERRLLAYYEDYRAGRGAIWHTDIPRAVLAELWARKYFGESGEGIREVCRRHFGSPAQADLIAV